MSLDKTTEVIVLVTVDIHSNVCGLAQILKEAFENFNLRQIMSFIWHSIQFIVEEMFVFLGKDRHFHQRCGTI